MYERKYYKTLYLFLLGFLAAQFTNAQTDTLKFENGEYVIGEIKYMKNGVITLETSYSDEDFMIDWIKVNNVSSKQTYFITLTDGSRYLGQLSTENNLTYIYNDNALFKTIVTLNQIVDIRPIENRFWERLNASIDLGYNITKANNLHQFNTRALLSYRTKGWETSINYNNVYSSQDSIVTTNRIDAGLIFILFLPKDWFIGASNEFLSNNEIKLNLRSTSRVGLGNYIVHTNSMYLSLAIGGAYNNESFTDESPLRQSFEGYAGFDLNLFDVGDLSLQSKLSTYSSLTEEDRFRADFTFDIKYDLPKDFYIKLGITLNYDNQPATEAEELDYVLQTGLGWEW